MPLYEYECDACHHRFERIQKYSDPLVDVCPSCGGPVKKLFSSPAFQFKGSGFYKTDYPTKTATEAGSGKSSRGTASSDSSDASSPSSSASSSATAPATSKGDSGKTESVKSDAGKSDSGKSDSSKKD